MEHCDLRKFGDLVLTLLGTNLVEKVSADVRPEVTVGLDFWPDFQDDQLRETLADLRGRILATNRSICAELLLPTVGESVRITSKELSLRCSKHYEIGHNCFRVSVAVGLA